MQSLCIILCLFAVPVVADEPKLKPPDDKKPVEEKVNEIAGTAEVLRSFPKHFAVLKSIDAANGKVTLLIDGEKLAKVWSLVPDAEVKVNGWWGRLDQMKVGDRVWAWFKTDRGSRPVAILMLADGVSQLDINNQPYVLKSTGESGIALTTPISPGQDLNYPLDKPLLEAARNLKPESKLYLQLNNGKVRTLWSKEEFEAERKKQKAEIARRWETEGLPGQVSFLHLSGEMDYLLDHEAMRWGRSLKPGDKIALQASPPIDAVVKTVGPWRERTILRLVVKGSEQAELKPGDRLKLKMTPPSAEVQESLLPPDLDRPRTRQERIEWFLASIYCTCSVKGNGCTGDFYSLASCNPNACGMPQAMRKQLAKKIDSGMTDRQIFEELLKTYGSDLIQPHLIP